MKLIDLSSFLGRKVDEAVEEIKASDSSLTVVKVNDGGSMKSKYYKTDRVRVYYNLEGLVSSTPKRGLLLKKINPLIYYIYLTF